MIITLQVFFSVKIISSLVILEMPKMLNDNFLIITLYLNASSALCSSAAKGPLESIKYQIMTKWTISDNKVVTSNEPRGSCFTLRSLHCGAILFPYRIKSKLGISQVLF